MCAAGLDQFGAFSGEIGAPMGAAGSQAHMGSVWDGEPCRAGEMLR